MANGVGASTAKGYASGTASGAAIGTSIVPGWGTLIGAAIGGTVGAVSGFVGGKKKANLQKEKDALISKREGELNTWFNTEYNKNILDTDYGKAMKTQLENRVKDATKQQASTAAITGASDEAAIASKSQMEKGIAGIYGDIAGQGQTRKEGIRKEFLERQSPFDKYKMDKLTKQQESVDNAMESMSTAGKNTSNAASIGAFDQDTFGQWYSKNQKPKTNKITGAGVGDTGD